MQERIRTIRYWVINFRRFWIGSITNREAKYDALNTFVLIGSSNSRDTAVGWRLRYYIHSWPNKTACLRTNAYDLHKMSKAVFKKCVHFSRFVK